jgi:hypothetical protein
MLCARENYFPNGVGKIIDFLCDYDIADDINRDRENVRV